MLRIAAKTPPPSGPPSAPPAPSQDSGPDPKALLAALASAGAGGDAPPDPSADPNQDPNQDPTQDDGSGGGAPAKIDQKIVVYMGADMGPFRCDNCCFYQDPGACSVVDGQIDPGGICHVYCPPNHDSGPDTQDSQDSGPDAPPDSGEQDVPVPDKAPV